MATRRLIPMHNFGAPDWERIQQGLCTELTVRASTHVEYCPEPADPTSVYGCCTEHDQRQAERLPWYYARDVASAREIPIDVSLAEAHELQWRSV